MAKYSYSIILNSSSSTNFQFIFYLFLLFYFQLPIDSLTCNNLLRIKCRCSIRKTKDLGLQEHAGEGSKISEHRYLTPPLSDLLYS